MFEKSYRVSMQKTYFSLCLSQIDAYRKILSDINELENAPVPEAEAHIKINRTGTAKEASTKLDIHLNSRI